ncbi:MAG: FumA C-terminus/TtdB family hydratase beta subunit [Clostridia bacterium]
MVSINTNDLSALQNLKVGDEVELSGTIYTARDAAHKKLIAMLKNNTKLPFDINGAFIYYAGPTPAKNGMAVGSIGPTTSSRMDIFTPTLIENGLRGMIGKGNRNDDVINACIKYGAVYFCAIGGAGALYSKFVKKATVIAFEELGCESIKKLEIENFPLIVGIDSKGNNIFVH